MAKKKRKNVRGKKSQSYDLERDLRIVTSGRVSMSKLRTLTKRITAHVLAPSSDDEVLDRIRQVSTRLEVEYWKKMSTKATSALVLRKIAQSLIAADRQAVFLKVSGELTEKTYLTPEDVLRGMVDGYLSHEETEEQGMNWFVNEYYRFVGASLERSVDFALWLLRVFHLHSLTLLQPSDADDTARLGIMPWSKVRRRLEKLKERVSDPSVARHNFKVPNHRSLGAISSNSPDDLADAADESLAVVQIVRGSALSLPYNPSAPQRLWLDQLLRHVNGNMGIEDILTSVVNILVHMAPDGNMHVKYCERQEHVDDRVASMLHLTDQLRVPGAAIRSALSPTLRVGVHERESFILWRGKVDQRRNAEKTKGKDLVAWMKSNKNRLKKARKRYRTDLSENARRCLRPNGQDHVELNIQGLSFVKALILHPEGHTFPDCDVEILIRAETPHLIKYRRPFRNGRLETGLAMFSNGLDLDEVFVKNIVDLAILDICHRIMVQGRELKSKSSGSSANGGVGRRHIVRPHLRKLRDGQQASSTSTDRAREIGWVVPEGLVFVRAHYRKGQITYDFPTEPTVVYTDDDLFEVGVFHD